MLVPPQLEEIEVSSHVPPVAPALSRETCLSPKGVRSFLNLSRLATDDVIKQRLNNLLGQKRNNSAKTEECEQFLRDFLVPSWRSRVEAIEYCKGVASEMRSQIKADVSIQESVDARLDPYAARDAKEEINRRYEEVDRFKAWLGNEHEIEEIVRGRTIGILSDTCGVKADDKLLKQF